MIMIFCCSTEGLSFNAIPPTLKHKSNDAVNRILMQISDVLNVPMSNGQASFRRIAEKICNVSLEKLPIIDLTNKKIHELILINVI